MEQAKKLCIFARINDSSIKIENGFTQSNNACVKEIRL